MRINDAKFFLRNCLDPDFVFQFSRKPFKVRFRLIARQYINLKISLPQSIDKCRLECRVCPDGRHAAFTKKTGMQTRILKKNRIKYNCVITTSVREHLRRLYRCQFLKILTIFFCLFLCQTHNLKLKKIIHLCLPNTQF